MADKFSKTKRSEIMSKISSKETAPEILVRKYLFSKGLRFRKNVKDLSGKPDIVLPKYKTIIFVHGCFWHGHTCKKGSLPQTNLSFWEEKIKKNMERDISNIAQLKENNWNVIVVWQCEISNKSNLSIRLGKLLHEIEKK